MARQEVHETTKQELQPTMSLSCGGHCMDPGMPPGGSTGVIWSLTHTTDYDNRNVADSSLTVFTILLSSFTFTTRFLSYRLLLDAAS